MKRLIVVILLALGASVAIGQDSTEPDPRKRYRFVGVNMSEMIHAIIPFKNSTIRTGPFAFAYRSGKGGRFFNFELGARIQQEDFFTDEEENYLNIQIGMLQRRKINERFYYTTSQNLLLTGGGLNIESQEISDNRGTFGLSLGAGFEYKIIDRVYAGTYMHFTLSFGALGGVHFVPPVGIFLLARVN